MNFVSHLTSKRYSSLPSDFVSIGFLKAEALESVVACGLLEPLTVFLENASKGGGAKAVRERFLDDFRQVRGEEGKGAGGGEGAGHARAAGESPT